MDVLWHEASAIADPERELYELFSLVRGSLGQMFGVSTLFQTIRSVFKGNGVGAPKGGDVRQMPGMFLIEEGEVTWQFDYENGIGELPDWSQVPRFAE